MLEVVANIGFIVGPLIGGTVFQYAGFLAPFAVSAVLHILFLALSLFSSPRAGSNGADPLLEDEGGEVDETATGAAASLRAVCYRKVLEGTRHQSSL